MPTIGLLASSSAHDTRLSWPRSGQGLNEAGVVDGRNVAIEYRWADGRYDRLPALAWLKALHPW
jgi:putative tryptophan/tyrosine transport system substrate-binding protein